jgi:hypothetical protein
MLKTFAIAFALTALPVPTFAQGIEIGPRGIEVDPGPGSRHHDPDADAYARECEELRSACLHKHELGEEGEGNCERYRERCK